MTVAARDRAPVTDVLGELPDRIWLILCYGMIAEVRFLGWADRTPDHPVARLHAALMTEIARLETP